MLRYGALPRYSGPIASACLGLASTAQATCPQDCDASSDGTVDVVDLLALLGQWGLAGTACDLDGNGISVTDLLELLSDWGPCPLGACSNPEDASCAIVTEDDCTNSGGTYAGDGTSCLDTDADRIPDAFELGDCIGVGAFFAGTDPLVADTDDDGITDGDEFYGTLDEPAAAAPLLLEGDVREPRGRVMWPARSEEPVRLRSS